MKIIVLKINAPIFVQILQRNANKYKEQLIYIYDTWRRSKASKVAATLSENFHFSSKFQRKQRERRKNAPLSIPPRIWREGAERKNRRQQQHRRSHISPGWKAFESGFIFPRVSRGFSRGKPHAGVGGSQTGKITAVLFARRVRDPFSGFFRKRSEPPSPARHFSRGPAGVRGPHP